MSVPSATHLVRAGAALAALVLAVLSRGDALVLAALLAVATWRAPAVAVVPALIAASWRWGSTSLEALAGAQAVLGPAGWTGSARAAAGSWLAALAVVLTVPGTLRRPVRPVEAATAPRARRRPPSFAATVTPLLIAASGTTAAAVVAGPAPGGDVWIRVVAALAGAALAAGAAGLATRDDALRHLPAGGGALTGIVALVLVAGGAPAWAGTVDRTAVWTGALVAVAVAGVVAVGGRAAAALGNRAA